MSAGPAAGRPARAVRLLLVSCLAVASTALATLAIAAPASTCHTGRITPATGGWTRIRPPAFVTGGSAVTTLATALGSPDVLYATNGTEVDTSTDGGCSWVTDFTVPAVPSADRPFSSATAQVHQIVTTSTSRVYLLVEDTARLHVMVSDNNGGSWRLSDTGLAHADPSEHARLVPSASPGTLYLLAHLTSALSAVATAGADVIYVTTDDGQSWTPTSPTTGLAASNQSPGTVNDLAVDPRNPQELWAATSSGLAHSADGGTSWIPAGIGGQDPIAVVDVAHDANAAARVLAFEQGRAIDYISVDGGSSWVASATPAPVDSTTWGYGGKDTAITAGGAVYQMASDNPASWAPIWHRTPDVGLVAANHLRPADLYACECGKSGGSLWRHAGVPPPIPPYGFGFGFKHPPPDKNNSQCMADSQPAPSGHNWGQPQLNPAQSQVVLAPGETKTVPYTFVQPPRELDVFFAEDAGPRSEFSACPFKFGMVKALNAVVTERNIRAGLGDIGDYPGNTDIPAADAPFYGSTSSNYPYKLDRIVGQVDQELYNRIAKQVTWWGNGVPNGDQANLTALYQAATGAGQVVGLPAAPTYRLQGGLQASFSPAAYNVVLHVAGKFFSDPSRTAGYPGPQWDVVTKTLNSLGIHQEGIWVDNRLNKEDGTGYDAFDGHADLNTIAKKTGTSSPKTFDCNGDGVNDVVQGGPLVCTYIAPAEGDFESRDPTMGVEMRRLIEALVDPQPISVKPIAGGSAVARITPPTYTGVDDLLGHVLHYDVTYKCGPNEIDQSHPVTLAATVGSDVWATANTQVMCGTPIPPVPHQAAALPPVPPPPVPNPIVNPGVNPGVNPAPNPAPNPAQAPQAQPQPIAHLAAVPVAQEQPQLALQDAGRDLQANEPMSALPGPAVDPLAWAHRLDSWAGMALFALGAALARRVQLARAVARKDNRRERR